MCCHSIYSRSSQLLKSPEGTWRQLFKPVYQRINTKPHSSVRLLHHHLTRPQSTPLLRRSLLYKLERSRWQSTAAMPFCTDTTQLLCHNPRFTMSQQRAPGANTQDAQQMLWCISHVCVCLQYSSTHGSVNVTMAQHHVGAAD